jgi:hypothetical protein
MAKVKQSFKLSDLSCSIPDSGQYELKSIGTSGKEYLGLPPYDYSGLKTSLVAKGYKPEQYDYIACTNAGKVLYGGRRVWLMQKDMGLDQSTMVECEIWTQREFMLDLRAKMGITDSMVSQKDKDGNWVEPVSKSTASLSVADVKGYPNLKAYHKKKADISGYPYDYEDSDGSVVDAGKT